MTDRQIHCIPITAHSKSFMSNELERAVRCRNYAEELRIIAADGEADSNRLALLEVATAYDQIADSMEAVLRSRGQLRRANRAG